MRIHLIFYEIAKLKLEYAYREGVQCRRLSYLNKNSPANKNMFLEHFMFPLNYENIIFLVQIVNCTFSYSSSYLPDDDTASRALTKK